MEIVEQWIPLAELERLHSEEERKMRALTLTEVEGISGGSYESDTFEALGFALEMDAGIAEGVGVAADASVFGLPVGMVLGVGGALMGGIGYYLTHFK